MGISYRDKHRQDIYQQLCSEIMRSAVDTTSLQAIAGRALNHPDVNADPVLASMIRAFIAQREASLRAGVTPADKQSDLEHASKLRHGFDVPTRCEYPTREALLTAFGRLQRDFDAALAQFEEARAQVTLDRMRDLRDRFPVHIPAADLQRCEEQFDRLLRRTGQYQRQIKELAAQAAAAASSGDQKTAAWVMRRLQAINTLLPTLLPPRDLEKLQAEITKSGEDHETQETTRELMERQREVAAQIKNLAGVIHRFHEISLRLPPDDNAYRRAEANYRRAVEEIRGLDTNWLTSLVLQLEALIEDLDDPTGQMQNQLDRFIASVRSALNRLCLEIRARQRARSAPRNPEPPPTRPADSSPPPP